MKVKEKIFWRELHYLICFLLHIQRGVKLLKCVVSQWFSKRNSVGQD